MSPTKDKKEDWDSWIERIFYKGNFSSATSDMKKNTKATLTAFANKFDLVSREDFNVQRDMLVEATKRLSKIEERLDKISGGEKKTAAKKPARKATKKTAGKKKAAKAAETGN